MHRLLVSDMMNDLILPTIVGERPVGLRHPVSVFLLFYRRTAIAGRVDNFRRQFFFHRFFCPSAGGVDDPTHAERNTPLRPHFYRDLIGRAADPPGADFNCGTSILDGTLKHPERILFGLRGDDIQRSVKNRLGDALLALVHDRVNELGDDLVAVLRIRQDLSFSNFTFSRHKRYFGFFAPYLERLCRLS